MSTKRTVTVTIDRDAAWHLALLLKRLGWSEVRACAQDDAEAEDIRAAIEAFEAELRDRGIAPR